MGKFSERKIVDNSLNPVRCLLIEGVTPSRQLIWVKGSKH